MEVTHGYHYDKSDSHNSPNGTWYRAEAGGKTFFLKKFSQPKYPKDGIDPKLFKAKKKDCDEWLAAKKKLIKALDELGNGTGNIISPRDVFREKLCFYQATYWIDVQTDSLDKIRRYSYDDKIMLLKTYAAALKKVHSKDIIHGDLKPENILIGKSASGKPVAKLIDFDDSYFSKQALPPELTVMTDAFQSPELAAYKFGNLEYREKLTCASDVFASGIIIHQFWCGDMPDYPGKKDGKFVYEAVAAGHKCTLDKSMPEWLQNLVQAMLRPLPEDRPTMEEVHIAVSEQKFGDAGTKPAASKPAPAAKVNYAELDKVWACIPGDLSGYTTESVATLKEVCSKITKLRPTADQATINKCTKILYSALKHLKKAAPVSSAADYSKIEKILAAVPKDLSDYTAESVARLKKTIRFVEANRNLSSQSEVDKMTKVLFAAYKGLQIVEQTGFSIKPAATLPKGYAKVKILSEDKVCVYTTAGSKMTIPRVAAQSLGLVVPK